MTRQFFTLSNTFARLLVAALLAVAPLAGSAGTEDSAAPRPPVNTFSIVAVDPATGDLGVAVASRVLAAGAIVPYVEADVGAVATQAWANPVFGPQGLAGFRDGKTPDELSAAFQQEDANIARRQFGLVRADGQAAAFTGKGCNEHASHHVGDGYTVQGNLLAGPEVIADMRTAYEAARASGDGELADWMLAALTAAEAAGGDRRGKQSAAILVARKGGGYGGNDRYIDLRVDDDAEPVAKLARLLALHKQLFRRTHETLPTRKPTPETGPETAVEPPSNDD